MTIIRKNSVTFLLWFSFLFGLIFVIYSHIFNNKEIDLVIILLLLLLFRFAFADLLKVGFSSINHKDLLNIEKWYLNILSLTFYGSWIVYFSTLFFRDFISNLEVAYSIGIVLAILSILTNIVYYFIRKNGLQNSQ